ncbi:hypothetical protein HPB49_005216 [Dermacentor silvarum]|uniref:Uncharacterized protein n=1 Tax=Dermacentor silvarum TaxID=543639 RepID=A0ACB8CQ00_DERSI|nr:hypothetical protein HPB49_005216 [Dermacentor silvarum]
MAAVRLVRLEVIDELLMRRERVYRVRTSIFEVFDEDELQRRFRMLILPGGRLKVIDFDTTKVCHGLFSKRVVRGFFRKTPFEFNDAESAGTVPYMAPEVLRQRPYGEGIKMRTPCGS